MGVRMSGRGERSTRQHKLQIREINYLMSNVTTENCVAKQQTEAQVNSPSLMRRIVNEQKTLTRVVLPPL